MPFYKDIMSHGNLYIQFQVDFPSSLSQRQIEQIQEVFSEK